jgi:arginase
MAMPRKDRDMTAAGDDGVTLRLLWPQWQSAGTSSIRELAAEYPFDVARRAYAVGSAVLAAVLPAGDGPTATAPVTMGDEGLEMRDGIEAKDVIVTQLCQALDVIRRHGPARIVTLGGECAVSVAPFAELAHRYGDDLAVIWIDSTLTSAPPTVSTPASTPWPSRH